MKMSGVRYFDGAERMEINLCFYPALFIKYKDLDFGRFC